MVDNTNNNPPPTKAAPVSGSFSPTPLPRPTQPKPSMPLDNSQTTNLSTTPPPKASSPSPTPTQKPKPGGLNPVPVKKSPFRFIVPILIFLILLAGGGFAITRLLPLFTSSRSEEPAPVEIVYWGLWESSQVMQDVISEFESLNPTIKVSYQQQSHKDYRERLQNALDSSTGPDLFRYHHTWVPMLSSVLSTVPSDIISSGEYEQTFYPVAHQWLRSNKGIVGIPLMIDGLGLYYNTQVLSAAAKPPPETWDELRRTAKQVTVRSEDTILRGGVALGTTSNVDHWPDIVGLMLLQNAAEPQKPNNQLGQDAITFYTLFSTFDQVWDDTMPESTLAFATEKVVMMLAPSWRAHDVANINPELEFAVAPVPQLPNTDISWASFWAEGVSSKSSREKQAAAWKFISYLAEKETLRRFYQNSSNAPGRLFGEPFSRVDLADQLSGDPFVGAFISQAPSAKSWFLSSHTWDNGLNDRIIKYYQDAINAVIDGEDAADVLSATEQGIAQVYSQFNIGR